MKKFIISEEEKNRILGMHQDATKRHYLGEQNANSQQSTGLSPAESKAIKEIENRISRGEKKPVVILPENPTIAYQYPAEVESGETPYWANGLYVYGAFPGKVGNVNDPKSRTVPPYAGIIKTVSLGTDKKWTSESNTIIPPKPTDAMAFEGIVGPENFVKMIVAAANKLDENSKNIIKQYVANSKEYPQQYKQIIANA